ncbi:EscD/YscD/HrpQ family type III secretion system inner membrane ring protein [Vibrio sp. OCN044]|uniref:EscD/YscD/HrpQ family type III secretion system inner membrane ring protein n=1 Tax=Vibrio tetraodonis subsp. pristinus TaxID=2695891 RepID=A0A6L8LS05_9VIBR|nr:type III secretion system inner membrane ring subunit SctD [Vibrio tetraodonis]MYM58565.1 EscD/YscD/HrpQ family type III secretion system inner membrane ring protein [Vibrio tetraodonis subsp. pristinus]
MEASIKLLWLTGPMQGRELKLPSGDLSMGPSGDIMVPIDQPDAISLSVDDKGVMVKGNVATWVSGKRANLAEYLPLGQPIELSGVGFILGHCEQELTWQKLPSHSTKKSGRLSNIFLFATSLFALVTMLVVLMLPVKTVPVFNPRLWLQSQLNVPALHQVDASWGADGIVTLTGYCDNSASMAKLKEGLKQHSIRFNAKAVCTDKLVGSVESILSANGYQNIHVAPTRRMGEVRISGAIQSGDQWDKVTTELEQIQGLKHWQVANDMGGYVHKFISALREHNLLNGVMVERRQESILVTGQLNDDVRSQIYQVNKDLMVNTGQVVDVRFENIPIRDNLTRYLSGQIVSFGGNASHPFVELSNGSRLQINSKLENGYVVSHIDLKGLDLSRDGEVIHIPFIL